MAALLIVLIQAKSRVSLALKSSCNSSLDFHRQAKFNAEISMRSVYTNPTFLAGYFRWWSMEIEF